MREILFRGKCIEDCAQQGEWMVGDYITVYDTPRYRAIQGSNAIETRGGIYRVDPDTIGEYTGLTDKHGQRIFEGDIIRYKFNITPGYALVYVKPVVFKQGVFLIKEGDIMGRHLFGVCAMCEIVGNIHDNPELLEGKGHGTD